MKKLVLETTSPFQGLPELVAYDEGLFAKEGIEIEWADRDEAGIKVADTSLTDVKGADPFVSHGTLLEQGKADMYNACEWGNYCRAGATAGRQPPGRPPRHRHLRRHRGAAGFAGLHAAAARRPPRRRAVLCRHALSRAAHAGRLPAARPDQCLPRADRLAQPLQPDDEGRDRGDHADRALHHARREEGLPGDLLGVLSRHRGRLRPRRRRDLRRLQSRGARGGAPHQRRQGARICITSSTITRSAIPRSARSSPRTCAPAASSWSIRRRSRPRNCSAPTTG